MGAPAFLSPASPLCDDWSGSFELMDILYVWICLTMYTTEPALETGWPYRAIHSCGFLSSHCTGSWFSPACCGRVGPVVWRCFWDVDGCEWRFRGELSDGSNTMQRVAPGQMWRVCYRVLSAYWVASVWHTWLQASSMCTRIFQWTVLVIALA